MLCFSINRCLKSFVWKRTRTMFYIIRHASSSVRFNFTLKKKKLNWTTFFEIKSVRFGLCICIFTENATNWTFHCYFLIIFVYLLIENYSHISKWWWCSVSHWLSFKLMGKIISVSSCQFKALNIMSTKFRCERFKSLYGLYFYECCLLFSCGMIEEIFSICFSCSIKTKYLSEKTKITQL